MSLPRIGLNCDVFHRTSGDEALRLNWDYPDAVQQAGGLPVPLVPVDDTTLLERQLDGVDGILLTGGDDYDPAIYEQATHASTKPVLPRRGRYDLAVARRVVARGLPVLGVCGGAQLLNIALGGTLVQDIPSQRARADEHRRQGDSDSVHTVQVEQGSRLAAIVGAGALEANSSHHQAIDVVARGLRVVARAPDGIIEAVERSKGPLLLGVQWHPERLADRPSHLALFQALVQAATSLRGEE